MSAVSQALTESLKDRFIMNVDPSEWVGIAKIESNEKGELYVYFIKRDEVQ